MQCVVKMNPVTEIARTIQFSDTWHVVFHVHSRSSVQVGQATPRRHISWLIGFYLNKMLTDVKNIYIPKQTLYVYLLLNSSIINSKLKTFNFFLNYCIMKYDIIQSWREIKSILHSLKFKQIMKIVLNYNISLDSI